MGLSFMVIVWAGT
ncbi:TPA: hypothetical protein QH012_005114, partial [Klebsiella pneumoniae subsp. pneumoniae]|nr:hypothetical protein [Klebsiella pneumoniae subsp. pneumoniae]